MKRYIRCTMFAAAALWILAACTDPLQELNHETSPVGSTGTVRVILPGGAEETSARTLLPSFSGITFDLTFSSDDYTDAVTKTITAASADVSLEQGTWNLKVEAKTGNDLIAEGAAGPIFVQPGKSVTAGVNLKPVQAEEGAGTFDYTVDIADTSALVLPWSPFPKALR